MTAFITNLNLAVTPQPPTSETVARVLCQGDSLPFNGSHRFRASSSLPTARLDPDEGLGLPPVDQALPLGWNRVLKFHFW